MKKAKYISLGWNELKHEIPALHQYSNMAYKIKACDLDNIINAISKHHPYKGYRFYIMLSLGEGSCWLLFKRKLFGIL